jgi:glycosyltransferase involved in cell wall biosynthesis
MKLGLGSTVWFRGIQSGHLDGIGHYSQELYQHLASLTMAPDLLPVVFGSGGQAPAHQVNAIRLPPYSTAALLAAFAGLNFNEASLRAQGVDLLHATDHYTPKFSSLPVVATLMDAIPLSHPQWVSQGARRLKNWIWRKSGHWADHVITISEFSKLEIAKHFCIAEEKISVTPLGVDDRYFERIEAAQAEAAVSAFNLPEQFFLFVGTFQPRKNIERIVDAHEALPPALRKDFPLLIVGRNGWGVDALVARLNAYPQNGVVRWLQNVDDLAKRVMMQRATALVFPCLLEGFGLPVLEGFASQTPVITSNVTSLPEVADDAAWMLDPYDVQALTEAMATLAREEAVGHALVAKGLRRARQFGWADCAKKTLAVYESVLK